MSRGAIFVAGTAMVMLSACTVGPNYVRPATPATSANGFAEIARANTVSTAASAAPLPDSWWRLYNDPVVDRLVGEALAHNTDIRVAAANLERARAVLAEQRGARLPTTDASASATRSRVISGQAGTTGGTGTGGVGGTGPTGTSSTGAGPTGAGPTGIGGGAFETNYYSLGFDASYEVDLFGGVSRAIEAARGDRDATAAQLDAARVAVAAETARAYATACSNGAQAAVARDTVKLQRQTLNLTRTLFDAGRGARRDVARADVLLAQTEAQIPAFDAERRASLYQLAVLTGRTPEQTDVDAGQCVAPPRVQTIVPVGDGAALLARRPDIRAAERTLAADTARVGVETAALYPTIRLLGSVGLGATQPGNVVKGSSFSFSVGPLISWSFPNQTAARARIRQARAGSDASLARFDAAILTALSEVEQALARYQGALDRNAALARAEVSSTEAANLSRLRFDYGADSFLLLIQAERDRADARAARAASDAQVADAQISLFKALGGGWEQAPRPERRDPNAG